MHKLSGMWTPLGLQHKLGQSFKTNMYNVYLIEAEAGCGTDT